jgi:hypothetical protein
MPELLFRQCASAPSLPLVCAPQLRAKNQRLKQLELERSKAREARETLEATVSDQASTSYPIMGGGGVASLHV